MDSMVPWYGRLVSFRGSEVWSLRCNGLKGPCQGPLGIFYGLSGCLSDAVSRLEMGVVALSI